MLNCTLCDCDGVYVVTRDTRPSTAAPLHSTSVRVIPRKFPTESTVTVSSSPSISTTRDELDNKINQFPDGLFFSHSLMFQPVLSSC